MRSALAQLAYIHNLHSRQPAYIRRILVHQLASMCIERDFKKRFISLSFQKPWVSQSLFEF
jgi:hypothetical protein